VGLICLAVASTGVVSRTHLPEAVAEQVRFATLPFRALSSPARRSPTGQARNRRARDRQAEDTPVFKLPELMAAFDLVLPDEPAPLPDYRSDQAALEIGGTGVLADDVLHLGLVTSRRTVAGPYDAYDEVAVEKRVLAVPANPKPRYPYRMLSRGIETNFTVSFVVDSSGTVDRETVELPRSVQQEFTSAVAEVLFDWRFRPAEVGGRRVRQRVLQPFTFRVEGQYSSIGRQ
jgi:TonB family protein